MDTSSCESERNDLFQFRNTERVRGSRQHKGDEEEQQIRTDSGDCHSRKKDLKRRRIKPKKQNDFLHVHLVRGSLLRFCFPGVYDCYLYSSFSVVGNPVLLRFQRYEDAIRERCNGLKAEDAMIPMNIITTLPHIHQLVTMSGDTRNFVPFNTKRYIITDYKFSDGDCFSYALGHKRLWENDKHKSIKETETTKWQVRKRKQRKLTIIQRKGFCHYQSSGNE